MWDNLFFILNVHSSKTAHKLHTAPNHFPLTTVWPYEPRMKQMKMKCIQFRKRSHTHSTRVSANCLHGLVCLPCIMSRHTFSKDAKVSASFTNLTFIFIFLSFFLQVHTQQAHSLKRTRKEKKITNHNNINVEIIIVTLSIEVVCAWYFFLSLIFHLLSG